MNVVHVWHISWAVVRRVRVSNCRRMSSRSSGIEKVWDLADSVMETALALLGYAVGRVGRLVHVMVLADDESME